MRFWKQIRVREYKKLPDGSIRIVTPEGKVIRTNIYVLEDDGGERQDSDVVPEENIIDMTPEEAAAIWELRAHA